MVSTRDLYLFFCKSPGFGDSASCKKKKVQLKEIKIIFVSEKTNFLSTNTLFFCGSFEMNIIFFCYYIKYRALSRNVSFILMVPNSSSV